MDAGRPPDPAADDAPHIDAGRAKLTGGACGPGGGLDTNGCWREGGAAEDEGGTGIDERFDRLYVRLASDAGGKRQSTTRSAIIGCSRRTE